MTSLLHLNKGFCLFWGSSSDFCKNLTEFYQISLKNLSYLTDFSTQHMACMYMYNNGMHIRATTVQNQQNDICAPQTQISLGICRLRCLHERTLGPQLPTECTAKTDQSAQALIRWVHSPTDHFVGFVTRRLNSVLYGFISTNLPGSLLRRIAGALSNMYIEVAACGMANLCHLLDYSIGFTFLQGRDESYRNFHNRSYEVLVSHDLASSTGFHMKHNTIYIKFLFISCLL